MPHIHLETTSDLPENSDVPDILEALVQKLSAQEGVRPETVKAYHSLRSVWAVGEGHRPSIAHCTVMLLEGRPEEQQAKIADALFETLREHFAASLTAEEVNLTLEVREMKKATYRR